MRYLFLALVISSIFAASEAEAVKIPPTPAFPKITTDNNTNVYAMNYSSWLHIKGTNGVDVLGNNLTKTIIINGSGSTGPPGPQGPSGTNGKNGTNGTNGTNGSNATATYDTLQNIGGGQASIYAGNNTKTNFQIKTITATGAASVTNGTSLVTIHSNIYQNNTGANLGTSGTGVYSGMSGSILQFLKLISANTQAVFSSNATNVILTIQHVITDSFKSNTTTCSPGYFMTAFSNSTGGYTCNPISYLSNTVFKADTLSCSAGSTFTGFNNVTGSYTCTATTNTAQGRNIGSGAGHIYAGRDNSTQIQLRTLTGAGGITTSNDTTNLYITGKTFQNNSGLNVGKGTGSKGLYGGMSGSQLQFKNITAGTGISLASNNTDVTIASLITQGFNNLLNIGHGGAGVLKVSGNTIQGKNITSTDSHLTVSSNSTDVNLSTTGLLSSAILGSQNIGKGTNSVGTLAKATATTIQGRNFTGTSPITITKTNDTDVAVACPSCLTSAITSINSDTTAAQNIIRTLGNTTITNTTGTVRVNTGYNIPLLSGTQTFFGNNTMKFGSGGIIIRNPASTFTTTISNGAQTANGTLRIPVMTGISSNKIVDTLPLLNQTNVWLNTQNWLIKGKVYAMLGSNNLAIPGSSTCSNGFYITNQTDTTIRMCFNLQGMTSSGKSLFITPNQTTTQHINIPNVRETETFAIQPQSNFTKGQNGGNSTASGSTTIKMLGNYATLTPQVTGNIRVEVSGVVDNSVATDSCRIDVRASTSNMGTNGAALTGTLLGTKLTTTSATASANMTFSKIVVVTGLTQGTKEFFDLSFATITGGTCTIRNVDWLLQEY